MTSAPLELWGGVECTRTRVGERVVDQLHLTGHRGRLSDLDLFHQLGLRTLRVPLLWENIEVAPGVWDWVWADAYMARLRALKIRPIVGLVHHGSGPDWAKLTTEAFVTGLAAYADLVADRYPWVRDWTPINEPLTTARFSLLYGHWRPHLRSKTAFWNGLVTQIEAVSGAMAAIRRHVPHARLIQTEDFGCVSSTAACKDQATYENHRRFMTWDLLAGRVDQRHPLRKELETAGLTTRLDALTARPCPADLIGMNHYVTSDRFLDERLDRYPSHLHGGNDRMAYADVEAVRADSGWALRWAKDLAELAARYQRPVAVTECHIGCSADAQIAWLNACWQAALLARAQGVNIEAVTVWALLGCVGWAKLLCGDLHEYEAGPFDISCGSPRPTALAHHIPTLLAAESPFPSATSQWWTRSSRLCRDADAHTPSALQSDPAFEAVERTQPHV